MDSKVKVVIGKGHFQVDQKDLLCKNGCGYYGSYDHWQGYCSKCFRDVYLKSRSAAQPEESTKKSPLGDGVDLNKVAFSRFTEKKKQQSERKASTVKALFRKSHEVPKKNRKPVLSMEAQTLGTEFEAFLRTLKKPIALDMSKRIRELINAFEDRGRDLIPSAEQSMMVQDFYQVLQDRIASDPLYKDLDEECSAKLLDYSERYLTTVLYSSIFCHPATDDEDKDLSIQDRIRSLNWVTPSMLDASLELKDHGVREVVDQAIADLIVIDSKKSPQEKLALVVHCSRHVTEGLRLSRKDCVNADEFLPALIYVVLQANPPLLHSNLNFISRFANPAHLRSGEEGYFFTTLCCAVAFIESINAESLNLTDAEFQRYMSGSHIPNEEAVERCHRYVTQMEELKTQHQRILDSASHLQQQMRLYQEMMEKEINDCLQRSPWNIHRDALQHNTQTE